MHLRSQRTIRKETTAQGVGFLTGADVTLRFLPAPENHGIVFQRIDLTGSPRVPATPESLVPRQRRTGISADGVTIELVEHVMAALAGLQIDNCLIEINAPETPGFDGSCKAVVDALLLADFEQQPAEKSILRVADPVHVIAADGSTLDARPFGRDGLTITYLLDYGPNSPIPAQSYTINVTPESFVDEICFARTFILDSEIESLKAQGYGSRTTAKDLLVFTADGVLDNDLIAADECARHKILDCIGDFALTGRDVQGYFNAWRTGHQTNHEIMQQLRNTAAGNNIDAQVA